jgi:hypothetical protein
MDATKFPSFWFCVVCALTSQLALGCGAKADDGAQGMLRVPQQHRVASVTCPEERGVGDFSPDGGRDPVSSNCVNNAMPGSVECLRDSDCTDGTRGRCLAGHFACMTYCSYDTCGTDTDCVGAVCECRQQATDVAANSCWAGGNCRVDSDCGPGGFCSPSQVATGCLVFDVSSGQGYFCHTANDSCLDNGDCGEQEIVAGRGRVCAYELATSRWGCHECHVGY